MNLKDKVVVVTGASSGIGEATVKILVKRGAKVVFGARRLEKLKTIAESLPDDQVAFKETDVSKHKDVVSLVDLATQKFGKVDALYNNAGIMPIAPLSDDRRDEWQQMLDINIMGVLNGISAVLPIMHKQGYGHILATDSMAGYESFPDYAVYCGTKYAVRAILDSLRKEESSNHIRTTIIAPGAVSTELYKSIGDPKKAKDLVDYWNSSDNSSLTADDVAEGVAYAISTPQRVSINELKIAPSAG